MKKRFTTLFLCGLFAVGALAQRPTVVINKASADPVVDGVIDEVWAEAGAENNIDQPGLSDGAPSTPSLGESGETTWQSLWTYDGIYVLLRVNDNDFHPSYEVPGSNSWEYDKPELYFDVNYTLEDEGGPSTGNGHYQVAPAFTDGGIDGTPFTCGFNGTAGEFIEYAFMVEDPSYIAEYFIPFSSLLDETGVAVDITGEIGFDATIIDRDEGDAANSTAVWTNIGTVNSSWVNMDGSGIITLDGAATGTYIDEITLEDGAITENNGMLQMVPTILPVDATNQNLIWSVARGTGKASIDKDGMLTGILDGDVTVTAVSTDGSFAEASAIVSISNQIVSIGEINVLRNPNFDDVIGTTPAIWAQGGNIGDPISVVDGIAVLTPGEVGEADWQYSMNQSGLTADPDVEYVFSFLAWGDDVRTFHIDFEDTQENNWNRYGASSHELATDGRSDWIFDLALEPTRYTFDVTFDQMVETTVQMVTIQLGTAAETVYVDSFLLATVDDMALITDYIAVESIVVSGDASVAVSETAQMAAVVAPSTALLTDVSWSVENGTGEATIDASGMLTGVVEGSVTVIASAKDDSGVTGVMDVTVGGGLGIDQKSAESLKVYPNPAVDELYVELTGGESTISIYNSVGMKMDEVQVSGSEYIFDISSYAAGIYFVRTEQSVARFVK